MVLIDSTMPKKPTAASTDGAVTYNILGRVSALASTATRFGLGRLYGQFDWDSLPPASRDEARASVAKAGQVGSTIDEYVEANTSMEQAAALVSFADKPLVVLTAGSGSAADWLSKQETLAALSTNSAHRVIAGATHSALLTDETYAAVTTQAILDVVTSVRSAVPLVR
jgi:hypothetical protein